MKYIKKFQQGGYLQYTWTPSMPPTSMPGAPQGASGTSSSSTSSGSGSDDWLDKDLKKELLKGGLTNDVNAVYSQLSKINGASTNAFLDPNNRQLVYALGAQINELQRNKDMWVKSYGIAEGAGGLNEIAVGNSGEIYVKDSEGIIKGISVAQYKRRPQLYQTLSVAELLEKRNTDAQLTNNNDVFNVANNAIGIKNITSDIQKIITALGTEKTSETSIYDRDALKNELDNISYDIQMTGRQMTDSERKGFAILNTLMSSPSRYNEIMSSESTDRNHLDKAVSYIWSTMSDAAQRKLTAQAALNNTTVEQIITSAAIQFTEHSVETKFKPISESQAKTGSDSGDMKNTEPLNNFQTMLRGTYASDKDLMKFNDPEQAAKFEGLVLGKNPLTTPDEKPIGPSTIGKIFKNSGYENYVDTNNIYFGNTKVNIWDWDNIVTDGTADVTHVLLPVNEKGQPDNASLESFRNLMEEYNENKDNMSHTEVQKLFNNSGFNVRINDDKTINVSMDGSHVKPFLITTAYTNSAVRNLLTTHDGRSNTDADNGGIRELSNDENKAVKPLVKKAWTITEGGKTKDVEPSSIWRTEHLYKGVLYMPLRDNYVARADSSFKGGPRVDQYREEVVMQNNQNSSGIRGINASIEELTNGK